MKSYTVYFLIKDIVSTTVSAESDEKAKEKAKGYIEKELYKGKSIECLDGKTIFAGFNIDEVWEEMDK